jgi:hypothetical protein
MRDRAGLSNGDIDKAFGFNTVARHWTDVPPNGKQPAVPTLDQIPPLLALFGMTLDDVPDDIRTLIWTLNGRKGQPGEAWFQREVITEKREDMFGEYEDVRTMINTKKARIGMPLQQNENHQVTLTAPHLPTAQQWHGFGTALKPANEPAVLARKPLSGTVADNVTAWGVGALNIDGCRVGTEVVGWGGGGSKLYDGGPSKQGGEPRPISGRWPANIILDEEAAQMLDEQSGVSGSSNHNRHNTKIEDLFLKGKKPKTTYGHSDSGGASRFFYVAKASKAEREAGLDAPDGQRANIHTTVKPIALMRYLVRMVTPRDGVVLDPFMGSGTTGCAAMLEGVNFIGIDITPEYKDIAERRIQYWASQNPMGL